MPGERHRGKVRWSPELVKRHRPMPWKVRAALMAGAIAAGVPWAGCGSGNPSPPPASSGDAGQTTSQANVPKTKAGKRRLKADVTSRREHQKQVREQNPPSSP